MHYVVPAVFAATYAAMATGSVPVLRLNRSGLALIAVAVLLVSGAATVADIGRFVDLPTLILLFALMIVSGQFAAAGFYDWVAARLASARGSPGFLLGQVVLVAGVLSAVLANDIIAFAIAPILAEGTRRRGLDPRPYLIALAGACNAGSAMTIIGNPQNILIGQVGHLDFWRFLAVCAPPALVALALVFAVVRWQWRAAMVAPPRPATAAVLPPALWQTGKGALAVAALMALFATSLPREVGALAVAVVLLASRRQSSRALVQNLDWNLLVLFACLFVVTGAFSADGLAARGIGWLGAHALLPDRARVLTPLILLLSNTIGNVPAVMLLLSVWHRAPEGAMVALALLATLSGNLLIVGSLANIIVAERAAAVGVRLSFLDHARSGVPITVASLAAAVLWLTVSGWMPWR